VMKTPDGVFITPQQVVATKAFDRIGDILKERGLSLAELMASGEQIRNQLSKSRFLQDRLPIYGIIREERVYV
jgi:hypothetical protein